MERPVIDGEFVTLEKIDAIHAYIREQLPHACKIAIPELSLHTGNWATADWCQTEYGPPIITDDNQWNDAGQWFIIDRVFYFREAKQAIVFKMYFS